MLKGKQIVLGVSGSIAAYKAAYLTRLFVEAGAEVWPILTRSGARFLAPLTLSALTGHRTVVDMWSASEAGEISHVEVAHDLRMELLLDIRVFRPASQIVELVRILHQIEQ